nr:testis-specific serine/threonine-protein kinase 5-like isoform X2 [Pongo abelii]
MSLEWAGPQNKKTYPLRPQCRYSSRILHSGTCSSSPRAGPLPASAAVPASLQKCGCCLKRDAVPTQRPRHPGPCPLTQVRPQLFPPRLVKLDHHAPFHALPSVKGSSRQKLDQRNFTEQVHECKDNGYLLSSKKIGSGAFSKVYLADATHERMHHNPKLSSDLQGKRHTMIAIKMVSTTEDPVEFSRKLLPREISVTQRYLQVPEHVGRSLDTACPHPLQGCSCMRPVRAASSCWSWWPGATCWSTSTLHWITSATQGWRRRKPSGYSGSWHLKCENILLDDHGLLKLTGWKSVWSTDGSDKCWGSWLLEDLTQCNSGKAVAANLSSALAQGTLPCPSMPQSPHW